MLHEHTAGLVELAAGSRREGRLHITTRRRADHFLAGGAAGQAGWLEELLELAERHAARGEEVFVAPAARSAPRGEKQAVSESRFLWIDVDRPGQLHRLWAFLAERPCHMLIASGGSGGCHAYFRLTEPLPATRVLSDTGELVEPIERAHLRIIHRLGVGEDGRPTVADPACADRSRVMRLAGSVNGKTGAYARIVEADFALAPYPIAQLVGDLPDPAGPAAPRPRRDGTSADPYKRISPPEYFEKLAGIVVPARRPRVLPGARARGPQPVVLGRHEPGDRDGAATPGIAGRAARSTTSRRCCSAGPGGTSCAARRSTAPAHTSPTCSASRTKPTTGRSGAGPVKGGARDESEGRKAGGGRAAGRHRRSPRGSHGPRRRSARA